MKIIDLLKKDSLSLSFEVFPPKTQAGFESVKSATEEIAKLRPPFMSVTYGAGGGTSKYTLDIVQVKGKNGGYYIGERDFEIPELKLLVDSVQSSKFITQEKTYKLISKIENLASVYDGQLLQRQVYVSNRVKSMNESIYYAVDVISDAINQNRKIRYKYFEYTVEKERRFRHDGADYEVSPFALIWDDENYYMLAYGMMKTIICSHGIQTQLG